MQNNWNLVTGLIFNTTIIIIKPWFSRFCLDLVDPLLVDLNNVGVDVQLLVFNDTLHQRIQQLAQQTLSSGASVKWKTTVNKLLFFIS